MHSIKSTILQLGRKEMYTQTFTWKLKDLSILLQKGQTRLGKSWQQVEQNSRTYLENPSAIVRGKDNQKLLHAFLLIY